MRRPGELYTKVGQDRGYGDRHDRMGQESRREIENQVWGLFNAPYSRRLKWIPDENWRGFSMMRTQQSSNICPRPGFLPNAGNHLGVHIEMEDSFAVVVSYRYHGVASRDRLEAHAFPREDLLYDDFEHRNANLTDYTQSYIIDWTHDPVDTALCLSDEFTSWLDNACQLGLDKNDGIKAIPGSDSQKVTAQVLTLEWTGSTRGFKFAFCAAAAMVLLRASLTSEMGPNAAHWRDCRKQTVCETAESVQKAPY